jgi:predicted RNase H-like HicB family nuclease
MTSVPIIVEQHEDGFIAYPVGLKGVVVVHGASFEDALKEVESAIRFHVETFGPEVLSELDVQDVKVETLKIAV